MYRSKIGGVVAGPPPPQSQQSQHISHHSGSAPSSSAPSAVVMSTDAHYQLLSVPVPGGGVVGLTHNGQAKEQVYNFFCCYLDNYKYCIYSKNVAMFLKNKTAVSNKLPAFLFIYFFQQMNLN